MNDLEFFEFSADNKNDWDNFVINHKYGSIHQVADWKDFQETIPGRGQVFGFGVKDESGEILATTFTVRMEMGMLGKFWFYSARGPVFDPDNDLEAGTFLIQEVSKKLKATGAVFWRIDPYFSEENYDALKARFANFAFGFEPATQNYQPENTLEIDLRKSDEEILADIKRKGRYNINLARKKNVKVIAIPGDKVTGKDIEDFWKLNNETTSRDGFASHGKEYYKNFCQKLSEHTVLFFAQATDGTRIATAISTFCGGKAIYYFGASTSDPEYRNLMAPYLLQWEMMQYGKIKGCESYDFLGIAPENNPKHPYAGISEFKWKFGGERKVYATGKEICFSRFWYNLYQAVKRIKN